MSYSRNSKIRYLEIVKLKLLFFINVDIELAVSKTRDNKSVTTITEIKVFYANKEFFLKCVLTTFHNNNCRAQSNFNINN